MAGPQSRPGREVRDLAALQRSGSSSRVLNLARLDPEGDPEYETKPFFQNRALNSCILLKHRVRFDERFVFDSLVVNATKIIVPFSTADLALGGRSLFVGQRGWRELLEDICPDGAALERDLRVLSLVDELPSLDPFLLREHLKRHGLDIGQCYFAIADADYKRMQAFVQREISRLIEKAFKNSKSAAANETSKLVQILLSSQVDERFEPLRRTLGLEGDAYREGVFCWKGFLYYKWVLADLWPKALAVIEEIKTIGVRGPRDPELRRHIEKSRASLAAAIHKRRRELAETLQVYDDAFRNLTDNEDPGAFRDFLVRAPAMFTDLGERIGGISHVISFWRYCVPTPKSGPLPSDELYDILQDFEASLGEDRDEGAPMSAAS